MDYFDENGVKVEGVLSQQDADNLKKRKEELKKEAEKADVIQKELDTTKEELEKLQKKDYNWRKLEDMNEEEKKKLSQKELELMTRQEALEKKQTEMNTNRIADHKTDTLQALCGDDKELKKKVLHNFDRIKDEADTKEAIIKKMRDAYKMSTDSEPTNLINQVVSSAGTGVIKPENKGELPSDVKDLGRKMGVKESVLTPKKDGK